MGDRMEEQLLLVPSGRGLLPSLAISAGLLVFDVVSGLTGKLPSWLAIASGSLFAGLVVAGVVILARSWNKPWQARLDVDGVTVRGLPLVPWSALAEVRISRLRPSWLTIPRRDRVVVFVPRPGQRVPSVVVYGPSRSATSTFGAKTRLRVYGSSFVLVTSLVKATPGEIAAAVRRLSTVPCVGD
ncbi:hypothetical protein [Amycolatopsis sp. H20-H5]|uniref:hypothetical protein n=1 Tax=Amycolatopsis sp. H20-H5 TaxID=3046309 RepID=UPI002DBF3447|nr:hypothetical protein [Amycolatopsis sp. H20-H5]MEC3976190.1 hypothetical protein [Amycolatopsis sp. H20-H5]